MSMNKKVTSFEGGEACLMHLEESRWYEKEMKGTVIQCEVCLDQSSLEAKYGRRWSGGRNEIATKHVTPTRSETAEAEDKTLTMI